MKMPWEDRVPHPEQLSEELAGDRAPAEGEFTQLWDACTFAMQHVRIRVSHAGNFRMAVMRADDPTNPCGEIKLNDGSTIRVETFGAPGPDEPVHTGQEIMGMIIKYIRGAGLTIPV